jgi:hypothetical protein
MSGSRQAIDGVLGVGWYDEWQQMEKDTKSEAQRAQTNSLRFSSLRSPGKPDQLASDVALLTKVAADYRQAMNKIVSNQPVDRARVGQVHDVLTLVLGVVKHDNDGLDAAFAVGVVQAFVAIPMAVFAERSQRLVKLLEALKPQLEQAKRERNEAWLQATINTAVTAITLIIPPLGLLATLAKGGIVASQFLIDDALGPTTSVVMTTGSKSTYVASQLVDPLTKVERLGTATQKIAKGAGRYVTVAGFYFDYNEISIANRNIAKIESALRMAKNAYDDLLSQIKKNKPVIDKFLASYERWQVSIASIRKNADSIRKALADEMKTTRYQPA